MKRARLAAALVVLAPVAVAVAPVGCGDGEKPRAIATAKRAGDAEVVTPTDIPAKPAPAQSEPAAKAIVDAMLQAHGQGKPEALRAFRSFENVREGLVLATAQQAIPQIWTIRAAWPGRYHFRAEFVGLNTAELAWSGDKAWRRVVAPQPGPAEDIGAAELTSFKADATGEWLTLLFPLLEPETVVAVEPAKVVGGRSCPGVRVWHPLLAEAILYADPATKELAQVTFNGRESLQVVLKDFIVLEVKETSGVRLPSRVAQNVAGKQLAEWTFTRLLPKDPDAKLFDKP